MSAVDAEDVQIEILTRRNFLGQTFAIGCACAAACAFAAYDAEAQTKPPAKGSGPVTGQTTIGPLSVFAKQPDGIYDKFAKPPTAFLVVINEGKVYALTAICTHKQKALSTYAENKKMAYCAEHDSVFDLDGSPAATNANGDKNSARDPLDRHGISVNTKGQLVVDTSKTFKFADRDKEGAYVELPAKGSKKK